MRVDDLVLFAINTGEFYKTQCELARANASSVDRRRGGWRSHVSTTVFPAYKRDYNRVAEADGEPLLYSLSNRDEYAAALALQTYYRNHIKEGH